MANSLLRFPEAVRDLLVRRYRNQHRTWLSEGRWPLQIGLGCPTEEQARDLAESIPAWVAAWRDWTGPGAVVWCERRWRWLGVQRLPERLEVEGAEDVAYLAGEEKRWGQALCRYRRLAARWPVLGSRLARWYDALADFDAHDIEALETLLAWLEVNPRSNLFPRQLPIAGMDTKWLEPRLPIVADLLWGLRGDLHGDPGAYQLCGLREAPHTVRVRILDPSLRQHVGGMGDIAAPIDDLSRLRLPVERVFLVENLQTGLAFEETRGAVVVMGLGYGVSLLARVPWIADAECTYWGDLDTHGFAILNRARSCLRLVESALMDESTLLRYRNLWVVEKEQSTEPDLPLLTDAERAVYRGLREQQWGINVRLEQERIAWNEAWAALSELAGE
jgi:hypothetical protein